MFFFAKTLTIGQMQGKYQLQVMGGGVGHTVHEDTPQRVAELLSDFVKRNQITKMYNLNKKLKMKAYQKVIENQKNANNNENNNDNNNVKKE